MFVGRSTLLSTPAKEGILRRFSKVNVRCICNLRNKLHFSSNGLKRCVTQSKRHQLNLVRTHFLRNRYKLKRSSVLTEFESSRCAAHFWLELVRLLLLCEKIIADTQLGNNMDDPDGRGIQHEVMVMERC